MQINPESSDAWWMGPLRGLPVDKAGIAMCRLEVVQEVAHVSCVVTSLVGLKQRQGAALVAALRGGS
jgi:hypothetical protein